MKKLIPIVAILIILFQIENSSAQSFGIGTDVPDPNSILDIVSSNKGILIPRLSTAQRNTNLGSLTTTQQGLLIYNTDDDEFNYWDGSAWISFPSGGSSDADFYEVGTSLSPYSNSADIFTEGNVGIGETTPSVRLHVDGDSIPFRVDVLGTEVMRLKNRTLEFKNSGLSVFIGEDAGINDDLTNNWNIAIGHEALKDNVYAQGNIAIGPQSMKLVTGGSSNIGIGNSAFFRNTSGTSNIAIGLSSMAFNISGDRNVAIGMFALQENSTGDYNIGIGYGALFHQNYTNGNAAWASGNIAIGAHSQSFTNPDGVGNNGMQNTTVGYTSMRNNVLGYNNVALGDSTLYYNTSGNRNTSVGSRAMRTNVSGTNNTAIGYSALINNVSGNYNVAIGSYTLNEITNVSELVAIGRDALRNNSSGRYNVAVGGYALPNNSTGHRNTAIGYRASEDNTTGYRNTSIGYAASTNTTTGIDNTSLGYAALADNTSGNFNTAVGSSALADNITGINNIAVGRNTMRSNQAGTKNIAIGNHAMYNMTNGSSNIAIGDSALSQDPGTGGIVAIGYGALRSNISGVHNVGVGYLALADNTTGHYNTSLGTYSLLDNLTGGSNVAIGYSSLRRNTSGNWNTAMGQSSLYYNTNGSGNSAVGNSALNHNTSGSHNGALGNSALRSNTTGTYNVAIGSSSLTDNSTGGGNVAIGYNALNNNVAGNGNVAIGFNAGYGETGSDRLFIQNDASLAPLIYGEFDNFVLGFNADVAIGHEAPQARLHVEEAGTAGQQTIVAAFESNTSNRPVLQFSESSTIDLNAGMSIEYNGVGTGSNNKMVINTGGGGALFEFMNGGDFNVLNGDIIIEGSGTDRELRIDDDAGNNDRVLMRQDGTEDIYIGDIDDNNGDVFIRTGGSTELTLKSGTGFVGVNTLTPTWTFEVNGNAAKPGGGSWLNSSDERLKENIEPYKLGLNSILKIKPIRYNYNEVSGYDTSEKYIGVIAQELAEVAPSMIKKFISEDETYLAVDNSEMTYMLINAIKELNKMIKKQQVEIEYLKTR